MIALRSPGGAKNPSLGCKSRSGFRVDGCVLSLELVDRPTLWFPPINSSPAFNLHTSLKMNAADGADYRRLLAAGLAILGCAISIYLASYQYGGLATVWEPLFGDGSERVLHSGLLDWLGRATGIRIHDALLGAIAYGLEASLVVAMACSRATAARWLNLCYCCLSLVMGVTSAALVILQPTLIHGWCTLCLTSAAISGAITLLLLHDISNAFELLSRCRVRGGLSKPVP